MKLPFKRVYNFRPGFMKPIAGQKNITGYYKIIYALYPIMKLLIPTMGSTLHAVGVAMIRTVTTGYPKNILEIKDIKALAESN
jgi:hypothetical protein